MLKTPVIDMPDTTMPQINHDVTDVTVTKTEREIKE